jgi:hypothetical protein
MGPFSSTLGLKDRLLMGRKCIDRKASLGAGQLFQELVGLELRGENRKKNKEMGIPRADT